VIEYTVAHGVERPLFSGLLATTLTPVNWFSCVRPTLNPISFAGVRDLNSSVGGTVPSHPSRSSAIGSPAGCVGTSFAVYAPLVAVKLSTDVRVPPCARLGHVE
jgi:hypothetical protein